MDEPAEGSMWRHKSGRFYWVLFLTNRDGRDDYPRTVVYADSDNNKWSAPLSTWHGRMTEVKE